MIKLLKQILYSIYPQSCHLCKKIISPESHFCHECWIEINFITKPYCHLCGLPIPFVPRLEQEEKMTCAECVQILPPFKMARSAVQYNAAIQKLIVNFKQHEQIYTLPLFVKWLENLTKEIRDLGSHIIIPVPIHYKKMMVRHYNQAALLAKALGKRQKLTYWLDALIRNKNTKPQGFLKLKDRAKNVKNAFEFNLKYKEKIRGKRIILIDDVYTSGSTVKTCTKILLQFGAKDVKILTIARTVKK